MKVCPLVANCCLSRSEFFNSCHNKLSRDLEIYVLIGVRGCVCGNMSVFLFLRVTLNVCVVIVGVVSILNLDTLCRVVDLV